MTIEGINRFNLENNYDINLVLPSESFKTIFSFVQSPIDFKNTSLVCKIWKKLSLLEWAQQDSRLKDLHPSVSVHGIAVAQAVEKGLLEEALKSAENAYYPLNFYCYLEIFKKARHQKNLLIMLTSAGLILAKKHFESYDNIKSKKFNCIYSQLIEQHFDSLKDSYRNDEENFMLSLDKFIQGCNESLVAPNLVIRRICSCLASINQIDKAIKFIQRIKKAELISCPLDENDLIFALLYAEREEEALEMLKLMSRTGVYSIQFRKFIEHLKSRLSLLSLLKLAEYDEELIDIVSPLDSTAKFEPLLDTGQINWKGHNQKIWLEALKHCVIIKKDGIEEIRSWIKASTNWRKIAYTLARLTVLILDIETTDSERKNLKTTNIALQLINALQEHKDSKSSPYFWEEVIKVFARFHMIPSLDHTNYKPTKWEEAYRFVSGISPAQASPLIDQVEKKDREKVDQEQKQIQDNYIKAQAEKLKASQLNTADDPYDYLMYLTNEEVFKEETADEEDRISDSE